MNALSQVLQDAVRGTRPATSALMAELDIARTRIRQLEFRLSQVVELPEIEIVVNQHADPYSGSPDPQTGSHRSVPEYIVREQLDLLIQRHWDELEGCCEEVYTA